MLGSEKPPHLSERNGIDDLSSFYRKRVCYGGRIASGMLAFHTFSRI